MTEYVPLLIHLANEQGLSREQKRQIVTLELAGKDNDFFGVEYVAGEWQLSEADATTKAEKFIEDVLDGEETYHEYYEEYYAEFEQIVEEKIDQYDE